MELQEGLALGAIELRYAGILGSAANHLHHPRTFPASTLISFFGCDTEGSVRSADGLDNFGGDFDGTRGPGVWLDRNIVATTVECTLGSVVGYSNLAFVG